MKIRIVKKNDEYSLEYQVGDVFEVNSTWYGGANVTSKNGIPLSLDRDEYEEVKEEPPLISRSIHTGHTLQEKIRWN